jgi:hypothetical protein
MVGPGDENQWLEFPAVGAKICSDLREFEKEISVCPAKQGS